MKNWDSGAAMSSIHQKQPEQAAKDPWPIWKRLVVGAISSLPFLFALVYWTGPW